MIIVFSSPSLAFFIVIVFLPLVDIPDQTIITITKFNFKSLKFCSYIQIISVFRAQSNE